MSTYSTVTVDFATDRNVSEWNAVLLLMMYAIADLVSRLGSGWFTDKGFLAKSSMMTANLFLWALSLCVMPFCYSFYLHAIQAVVVGWCNGATLILVPVLLMELVNTDKFSECFGVALLISGIPLLLRPVLIGYFRDDLGDYQGLFVIMGVVTAISAFSCLFLREIPGAKGFLYNASELFCYKKRHANHNGTKGDKDIYLQVKMNQHESIT
ncbi:monocarboxylate transporter 13 [Ixodes scapularis]